MRMEEIKETPREWETMLRETTLVGTDGKHKYLAVNAQGDIQTFADLKTMKNSNYRKMKVGEVKELTHQIFSSIPDNVSNTMLKANIEFFTDKLNHNRLEKHKKSYEFSNKIKDFALNLAKFVSFISVIFIPVGLRINAMQREMQNERLREQERNAGSPETIMDNYLTELASQIDETDLGDVRANLNDIEDVTKDVGPGGVLAQFKRDYFSSGPYSEATIKDGEQIRKREYPNIPVRETVTMEERKAEDSRVNELIKQRGRDQFQDILDVAGSEKEWIPVIQGVLTQNSIIAARANIGNKANLLRAQPQYSQVRTELGDGKIEVDITRSNNGKIIGLTVKVDIPYSFQFREADTMKEMAKGNAYLEYKVLKREEGLDFYDIRNQIRLYHTEAE